MQLLLAVLLAWCSMKHQVQVRMILQHCGKINDGDHSFFLFFLSFSNKICTPGCPLVDDGVFQLSCKSNRVISDIRCVTKVQALVQNALVQYR